MTRPWTNSSRPWRSTTSCSGADDLSLEFPSDLARRFESVASFRNDLVQSYLSVSYMQAGLGYDEEALRSRQRAVEIAERVAREHPADTEGRFLLATAHGDLGVMLTLLRGPAEGLRAFDQCRAILEQLVAENPAVTDYQKYLAETCMNIAQRLEELGRSAEALGQFDKGDAILKDAAAANPTFTWLRYGLAVNRRRAGGLLFKVGRRRTSATGRGRPGAAGAAGGRGPGRARLPQPARRRATTSASGGAWWASASWRSATSKPRGPSGRSWSPPIPGSPTSGSSWPSATPSSAG